MTSLTDIEIIKSVVRDEYIAPDRQPYIGYSITTNKQTIKFHIENQQNCCERYGIMLLSPDRIIPNDETERCELIDNELDKVGWGTKWECKKIINEYDGARTAFINLSTDLGTYQIYAYNSHNGYYSHNIRAEWSGVVDEQQL